MRSPCHEHHHPLPVSKPTHKPDPTWKFWLTNRQGLETPGDTVFAGTLNQGGFLFVKVTHTHSDTTVAKIIHLVEQAQQSRAPTQQWVDRFAEVYTPIVILIAILIAVIPPLAFAQSFNVWFYRALVMLVIACPCALVISTPVSIVSAIGAATRQGVLFKGGKALETAGRMNILALVGSDLRRLADAVELSRRTVSVIQQNVVLFLVTKGLFLLLGTFGFVGLAVAVLADTGTSLLVSVNGMRLFRTKSID